MKYIIAGYIMWNIIAFSLMGIDKYKAVHHHWRISEGTLLLMAFCMGGVGSMVGSHAFNHKTKKTKFIWMLPLSILFNIVVLVSILYYITYK